MRNWPLRSQPGGGNSPRQQRPHEERHAQNRWIAEKINRNGFIASGRSGPPRLNSTIATRGLASPGTNQPYQFGDMFRRRFRYDAVAKVEHEWSSTHRFQDDLCLAAHRLMPGNKRHGIEVALYCDMPWQHACSECKVCGGIDPDSTDPGICRVLAQHEFRHAGKPDDRDFRESVLDRINDTPCRFDYELPE